MMFGEEYGSVLGKDTCPRCESQASLRGNLRVGTKTIVVSLVCNKCHHVQIAGFTSTTSIAHEAVKKKLEEMLKHATHPSTIRRLKRKLQMLEQRKDFNDLGL